MRNRPLATLLIIIITLLVTFMAPIFDSSIYGVNAHPTEWLSFSPAQPFRYYGLSLFFSPFIHLGLQHLIVNIVLFSPIAMMVERKESKRFLLTQYFAIHFQVLILLMVMNLFFPMENKLFLGSSHIIMGLYSYWSLSQKKWGMLFLTFLVLPIGLWQNQSPLTIAAHAMGFLIGIEMLFLCSLWDKIRSKRSN